MLSVALPVALLPDLGGGEFMLILLVVLLLFGGEKMPQLAKSIGKSLREFRKAASEVEQEIKRAIDEVPDAPSIQTVIRRAIDDNTKPKAAAAAPVAPAAGAPAAPPPPPADIPLPAPADPAPLPTASPTPPVPPPAV